LKAARSEDAAVLRSTSRISRKKRPLFEAERRRTRADAYAVGRFGAAFLAFGVIFRWVSGSWIFFGFTIFGVGTGLLAVHLYRRRGELLLRVVGDAKRLKLVRGGRVVTIRFKDLIQVEYTETDGSGLTEFSLRSGGAEYVNGLHRHEPMLAFVRSLYTGPMIYKGESITQPDQIPGALRRRGRGSRRHTFTGGARI